MKFGEDYEKMAFTVFNLDLLEPNSLISDTLISVVGISLAIIVGKRNKVLSSSFFNYWKLVFLAYGISFFFGGMGHVFFNYFGVLGKYLGLVGGLFLPLLIEFGMISLLLKQKKWLLLSRVKFALAFVTLTLVAIFVKGDKTLPALLLVPSINTLIGYVFACGVLGWKFGKEITRVFYLLPLTVLILIPAALAQMLKINFHPWFDRNDFGHALIIITLFLYFFTIEGYRNHLLESAPKKLSL